MHTSTVPNFIASQRWRTVALLGSSIVILLQESCLRECISLITQARVSCGVYLWCPSKQNHLANSWSCSHHAARITCNDSSFSAIFTPMLWVAFNISPQYWDMAALDIAGIVGTWVAALFGIIALVGIIGPTVGILNGGACCSFRRFMLWELSTDMPRR